MQMSWMETTSNPDVLKALQTATDLALRALWVMRCLHLWSRSAISSCVWPKWGMPSKFGSSVPRVPDWPLRQRGRKQTLPNAGELFSQHGVRFGHKDSRPHRGTCAVGAELLEFSPSWIQTISEAPGVYGSCIPIETCPPPFSPVSLLTQMLGNVREEEE